jgi:hypothetical protein
MRNLCRWCLALIALATLASAAHAQRGMFRPPDMEGVWNPVVGSGGSYELQKSSGEKSQLDILIVGKESVGGKDAYWLEIVMQDPKRGGSLVMKMLSAFDGSSLEMTKTVIQLPGQSPMELPAQMSGQSKRTVELKSHAQSLGPDTVTTPAGTFAAEHWKSNDGGEVWISPKAPPYGLIKSSSKDGTSLVLVRLITDAKDRITGTPVPFNPMNMAPPH